MVYIILGNLSTDLGAENNMDKKVLPKYISDHNFIPNQQDSNCHFKHE